MTDKDILIDIKELLLILVKCELNKNYGKLNPYEDRDVLIQKLWELEGVELE